MTIDKKQDGSSLKVAISGRLDTTTAPELDNELKASLDGISKLEIDFANLDYISSAGLRVLLSTQKVMNKQGSMVLHNVKEEVKEVFEVTGFLNILTIE